jgi:glycosyltransferase involved in cell wall biosynthesis
MSMPLLSLIIPTRERAQTLVHTIATALDQASQDFEVVVGDNASADGTRAVVEAIDDPRLRYFNSGERLSMCDNYEFALSNARGRHVIIIGDDDAVMPGGIDMLLERLRADVEPTIYFWPLHIYDWPSADEPAQAYYVAAEQPERRLELRPKARSVVALGGWKYYELPSPYHSAVPRDLLLAIKTRTGRVFHTTQPDVFTGMALPAFADHAVNVGKTVTLHGRSPKSNGRDFTRGVRPNIEQFIREYNGYTFHESLFAGMSAPARMIPDAIIVAKEMFPEVYGSVDFDYSAMWAYVSRLGFVTRGDVVRHAGLFKQSHPFSLRRFLTKSLIHTGAVARRKALNMLQRQTQFRHAAPDTIQGFVRALRSDAGPRP